MSLINDVLRDLERRRTDAAGGSRPEAEPRPPLRHAPRRWPWWIGAAAIAGAALHWTLSDYAPQSGGETPLRAQLPTSAATPIADNADTADTRMPAVEPEPMSVDGNPDDAARDIAGIPEASRPPASLPVPTESTRQLAASEPAPNAATTVVRPQQASEAGAAGVNTHSAGEDSAKDTPETNIAIERADHTEKPDHHEDLANARRALSRGQYSLAEQRLRGLLERMPEFDEARLLLANTLIRRNRGDDAVELLERGLPDAADASALAGLLGRLLLESGRSGRAVDLLVTHAPAPGTDPEYQLILAAAHRQAGDHEAAAEVYRAIADANPDRGAAWVGLGVSLETLGRADAAREAYRRALDNRDPRAARFARQRLAALGPPAGDRP